MPRGRPRKNVVADSPPSANSDSDNAATPVQQMGSDDERLSVASPAPGEHMSFIEAQDQILNILYSATNAGERTRQTSQTFQAGTNGKIK